MIEQTSPPAEGGTDHREGSPDYAWIVAQLSGRWRVVEAHDGTQWIIQKSRRTDGGVRWEGKLHFRSLAGLLLHVDEWGRRESITITPKVRQKLASLPAWIETPRARTGRRAAELVAA